MKTACVNKGQSGFTLVELAVTMLVIGIVVLITSFAWGTWQQRSAENALKNDLIQAAAQLKNELNWKNSYPSDEEVAGNDQSLPKSRGTSYEYERLAADSYCLTATSTKHGISGFYITNDDNDPKEGVCEGHRDPLVP